MKEFLLEHEETFEQGHDVVLLNTDEAGTIYLTNFRLLFVSKTTECLVELGTIPLTAIEEVNEVLPVDWTLPPGRSVFQVIGYDMRVLVFVFVSENKNLKKMIEYLKKCIKPVHLKHVYAFCFKPPLDQLARPAMSLLKEYQRLFQKWFAQSPSTRFDPQPLENKWWRVSEVNMDYKLCQSYPTRLIVPKNISDEQLWSSSTYRKRRRLPAISWFNPGSGAVLARSSQPRSSYLAKEDQLVCALRSSDIDGLKSTRKLYIIDARPLAKAAANLYTGGGTEFNLRDIEVCQSGIENIHAITESFHGLRKYVNEFGSISSNGSPLDQRDPILPLLSGRVPKSVDDMSKLQDWLSHIHTILAGASFITSKITGESAAALVHCSDGWDRTSQLVALSCLLLDPYYRTFSGFQVLVEKDWLSFGHKFSARMGLPTGEKWPKYELPWLGNSSKQSKECSPIFLQWLECIAHLICMYPSAFEFSSKFLVHLMDAILSCRFGNFLCNSELEREQVDVASCPCIWKYLADLRASDTSHEHRNPFYDPEKHNGPIVPPAPALIPTIWPQFYLRWACPLESHGGGGGFQELAKAKMEAEPRKESENLIEDEIQLVTGRQIRIVGSNVRKL